MMTARHDVGVVQSRPTGAISRRSWLGGLGAGTLGLSLARSALGSPGAWGADDRSLIVLTMVGGASPWETFDPKPDAPAPLRGPLGSIATAIPGVRVSAHLPAIAHRLDGLTLIRSLYHDADPTHDAGLRLLMTGRSTADALPLGSVAAADLGMRRGMPPFVVLPNLVGPVERPTRPGGLDLDGDPGLAPVLTGAMPGSRGFDPDRFAARLRGWRDHAAHQNLLRVCAGSTEAEPGKFWDWHAARASTRDRFGDSEFGRNCWLAGQLVAAGSRVVVVNMATRLFGQPTWDGHGRAPFGTVDAYARHLLPAFDQGFTALVDHLRERGRLDSTLVLATGEMGRTPWINESGGRDHWPGVWSALLAGGGTRGGQVIGSSTADGSQPHDHPIPIADLVAAAGSTLGLDLVGRPPAARVPGLFG